MSPVVERIQVDPNSLYYREHYARYQFAKTRVRAGWTLDIACGAGYGGNLLLQECPVKVVGVDIDLLTLAQTRRVFPDHRLGFIAADGTRLSFQADQFENIVSFETIEHIADDHAYLRELARVLRADGVCILSTPISDYSRTHQITNPYHMREYSITELSALLQKYFGSAQMFHQGFSQHYHAQVKDYAAQIQNRKRDRHPLMRLAIDSIYRPIKHRIPVAISNRFIRMLFKLSYPMPDVSDITISADPLPDASVQIAVCHDPLKRG